MSKPIPSSAFELPALVDSDLVDTEVWADAKRAKAYRSANEPAAVGGFDAPKSSLVGYMAASTVIVLAAVAVAFNVLSANQTAATELTPTTTLLDAPVATQPAALSIPTPRQPTPAPAAAASLPPEPQPEASSTVVVTSVTVHDGQAPETVSLRARAARSSGSEAARLYLRVLELSPEDHASMAALAQTYLRMGQASRAHRWAREASQRAPRTPRYRLLFGDALARQGRIAEAREAWFQGLALAPNHRALERRIDRHGRSARRSER